MWFMEHSGGSFEDKLRKGRTGHITKKISETGSNAQKHESGRPQHMHIEENVSE